MYLTIKSNLVRDWPFNRLLSDLLEFDSVGLKETENEYTTELVLAGYKKNEVSIDAAPDGVVTIKAENANRGKFNYSFYVGDNIDHDNIRASLADGVLSLKLPKIRQKSNKKIVIE